MTSTRDRVGLAEFAPLAVGLLVLAAATALGWDAGGWSAVVSPPPFVRLAL